MDRRSEFVTFLASLLPGAGYMYFGMIRFGIETMLLFFIVPKILHLVGLGFIAYIFSIPFWLYTFFDTYRVAHKFDRGEIIEDKSWFSNNSLGEINISNKGWTSFAWVLIVIGVIAILNKIFASYDIFYSVRLYIVPAIFILIGIYLLFKGKDRI
ncbi:hypothetical protein SAMN02745134_02145 [Clostridium acidisoli DSM 12555]|uniref:TM2 domain-containing protein n=1 Tax=Clostridium acidisoli DSM 12555 TaxID=1121291 RepID=A0A1W1XK75_9CLOT|nr:hypothetical protein [Clostridium acidisoli]SMC24393.1 hypothetical protein SAMN02745134_02145 [Clostridium acidisoli DSM 12555]